MQPCRNHWARLNLIMIWDITPNQGSGDCRHCEAAGSTMRARARGLCDNAHRAGEPAVADAGEQSHRE